MPIFSIVVPVYNTEKYLDECISSILGQSFSDFELILVNDGSTDNSGNIFECRKRGFETLEKKLDFLGNAVIEGSYGELWSLRKVLRRFIWHDRIHARAMYRMAGKVFGAENVANPFCF